MPVTHSSSVDPRVDTHSKTDYGSGAEPVFELLEVSKHWQGEHGFVLKVPQLMILRGEKVALVGYSGCGKSTLLDTLAMVLRPDKVHRFKFYADQQKSLDVADAWKHKHMDILAKTRMRFVGYVLQTGGLLPFISVYDNIALSRYGLGLPEKKAVVALAAKLGIERHLKKLPGQLSVGERQRVAIARAMAHSPSVVIADEPTASLDPINAEEIMGLFTQIADENGVTLIVATHEWERVKTLGFRRLKFNLDQQKTDGTVQATVLG